jgi:hypothetical protein
MLLAACERQMPPIGPLPRDATPSELSPFDGRWQLARSNPDDKTLPFHIVMISGNGQHITVDHPDAVASVISGEYLNSGVSQFVGLTISVALGTEQYKLRMRRPEAPDAPMSGRLSGDGIEGSQMVRVSPADAATD